MLTLLTVPNVTSDVIASNRTLSDISTNYPTKNRDFSKSKPHKEPTQKKAFQFSKNTKTNMSGYSSVGQASVYEAGDQRNSKESEGQHAERYHEGQKNSHLANDSSTFPSFISFTFFGILSRNLSQPPLFFSFLLLSTINTK